MVKYTREVLEPIVKASGSVREVCGRLGLSKRSGRTSSSIRDAIRTHRLDTSHFSKSGRRFTKEQLEVAVRESLSMSEVLRKLGFKFQAGGSHYHLSKRIRGLGIDTSHFLGCRSNLGKPSSNKRGKESILILRKEGRRGRPHLLRRALIESGIEYRCGKCGSLPEWEGQPLTLPVDHINGDPLDDRVENLRFLCPNCHSQTPTFSRRNRAGVL